MKIKYLTQTDKRWANNSMALKGDYLWRWGCLVTSISNIIQIIKNSAFTPKDFNDILINIKGYQYLSGKTENIGYASCIDWDVVKKYFPSLDFTLYQKPKNYKENEKTYYIARVIHNVTRAGHYINVISKQKELFECFDVEDGKIKFYKQREITFLHKIKEK